MRLCHAEFALCSFFAPPTFSVTLMSVSKNQSLVGCAFLYIDFFRSLRWLHKDQHLRRRIDSRIHLLHINYRWRVTNMFSRTGMFWLDSRRFVTSRVPSGARDVIRAPRGYVHSAKISAIRGCCTTRRGYFWLYLLKGPRALTAQYYSSRCHPSWSNGLPTLCRMYQIFRCRDSIFVNNLKYFTFD